MFHKFWNPSVFQLGLLRLNITGAKNISDYGLTVVARNSPNLTALTITGCSTITDVGMREVGLSCTKLQELNMSSCHGVEGQGLAAIAECCRYLIKFDVSKCRSVKGWSLAKIFYSTVSSKLYATESRTEGNFALKSKCFCIAFND